MSESYIVVERTPSIAEYSRVRAAAGLGAKSETAAMRGLSGGLYSVCVEHASEVVGIGRVIGTAASSLTSWTLPSCPSISEKVSDRK